MINKTKYLIIIFFLKVSLSYAQDTSFNFETKIIEILDNGNLINAKNGKATSKDKNFEIIADNFQYFNDTKILKISGNASIFLKSTNLKINFEKGIIDQKKLIFEAYEKIQLQNRDRNFDINSEKIIFNYENYILFSPFKSIVKDPNQNKLVVDNFNYEIKNDLLKVNQLYLTDVNNNVLSSSLAYIDTKLNNLFGKDVSINLDNKTFNKKSEPRMKGNAVKDNNTLTEIEKGIFTSCKKRDGCPPWQLSAEKIRHDKVKKKISYENALLKIYDTPVAYFPKFSHPDPTVKRESGFLMPSIKNSKNEKNFLNLPYYLVIADNKDATFLPRFYNDEEFLLQTEYRQANLKSNHISDFSFKINENKKLKSHLFYGYDKSFNLDNFIDSSLNFKFQKTSKDTYIKKNKIRSKLFDDINILENSAKLQFSNDDTIANFETYAYEDLNKNESDRFEYIFPKIELIKKIDNKTNLDGEFVFNFKTESKNYNTNVFEAKNTNELLFTSFPKITDQGFYNNYEFLIKNSNTDARNSSSLKNKENIYLSGIIQLNSSLPLIKENNNYKNIFIPKLALKMAPNYTKDYRNENDRIDINNIYSLYRNARQDSIEGGVSLTYGSDFSIFNKENSLETFNFKIANNLRFDDNDDLPRASQIDEKTSSFLNEISYQPHEIFKIEYSSSIKNNLSEVNYENLKTEFKINNLVTNFNYLNQNELNEANSYLTNNTTLKLDDDNQLSFSTRKNKTIDLTEYYNLAYQYQNDCLSASIEYNKEYYSDRDIKPNESISFKLTIVPFY